MSTSTSLEHGRILSIQSHVSFGYVGGKAAVFPLQCLGYEVDVVNTVNFSNHAGYGRHGGTRTNSTELLGIFESMEANGLLLPKRLLTGYVPDAGSLTAISELAEKLMKENSSLIYLLDPVMGDAGRLYVSSDVIPIYKSILRLATIITPNWFEAETLTTIELKDVVSLETMLRILHEKYHIANVVISSIPLKPWLLNSLPPHIRPRLDDDQDFLLCLSSTTSGAKGYALSTVHVACFPLIPGYFSGVGDLFAALLLGHFHPSSTDTAPSQTALSHATSIALTKTQIVLSRTYSYSQSLPADERQDTDEEMDKAEPIRKYKRMRGRELRLVQSQDIIRDIGTEGTTTMELWDGFWKN